MTPERIKELRALCEAATPGPWRTGDDPSSFSLCVFAVKEDEPWLDDRLCEVDCETEDGVWAGDGLAVANLIAAALTALPEALDEIERLREELRQPRAEAAGGENQTNLREIA